MILLKNLGKLIRNKFESFISIRKLISVNSNYFGILDFEYDKSIVID